MSKRSRVYAISFIVATALFYLGYFTIMTVECVAICGILSLLFGISITFIETVKLCALCSILVTIFMLPKIHIALIDSIEKNYEE